MPRRLPPQRFERTGLLAIEPKAFFELFAPPVARLTERVGNVDVIDLSGPLVQRDEIWCDSYESLRERFRAACESDASAIVLRFDSPGGDASGCFETARALRAEAIAAGKPLYAYVDRCCSAAFALASAATHGIAIGETCCAGSVGVLATRPDYTAQNTMQGVRMAFVVSGTRKLDGNPDYPLSEAELLETQRHVDGLANKFFALIEDMRPQLSAAQLKAFDGGVFYGDEAVSAGLADAVSTFEELLARASNGDDMKLSAKSDYEVARAALEKIAQGEDANAAAAQRALAAMAEMHPKDDEEEKPDEEPNPESADQDDDKPGAEDSDKDPEAASDAPAPAASDEPGDDEAPKKPKTQARSQSSEFVLAERLQRLEAQVTADREARTRRNLLAARPDFSKEVRAVLAKAPLDMLREAVNTWPKGKAAPKRTAPITTVPATRAESQVSSDDKAAPRTRRSDAADELDRAMGFKSERLGCKRDGSTLYFGFVEADSKPST